VQEQHWLDFDKAWDEWLQLANKSMLMSQKQGRRIADECRSPLQAQVAQAMLVNPPPSILDAVSKADVPKVVVD
jgi:hypothetical protein